MTEPLGQSISQSKGGLARRAENDLRLLARRMRLPNYADGHRSMLETWDAFAAEYTPVSVETMELCFRAFENARVMTIRQE